MADGERPQHVAGRVYGLGVGRQLAVGEWGERFVGDLHRLGCSTRRLGVVGRHQRHRLAEVPHHVGGQRRLVLVFEAVVELARYVVGREHGVHARQRQGAANVDVDDAGVGVG